MRRRSAFEWGVLLLAAAFFLGFGLWAFSAPGTFFEYVARWEPYNEHFLRDAGAFQIGIGVALLVSVKRGQGGAVALAGAASAATMHGFSHVLDAGEGGRSSDPYLLSALAVLLLVGLWAEWRRAT